MTSSDKPERWFYIEMGHLQMKIQLPICCMKTPLYSKTWCLLLTTSKCQIYPQVWKRENISDLAFLVCHNLSSILCLCKCQAALISCQGTWLYGCVYWQSGSNTIINKPQSSHCQPPAYTLKPGQYGWNWVNKIKAFSGRKYLYLDSNFIVVCFQGFDIQTVSWR